MPGIQDPGEVTPDVKKMLSIMQGEMTRGEIRLAFSSTPFIISAASWKNRKNTEKIQGDLQGMANNNPVKSQSIKIIEDT